MIGGNIPRRRRAPFVGSAHISDMRISCVLWCLKFIVREKLVFPSIATYIREANFYCVLGADQLEFLDLHYRPKDNLLGLSFSTASLPHHISSAPLHWNHGKGQKDPQVRTSQTHDFLARRATKEEPTERSRSISEEGSQRDSPRNVLPPHPPPFSSPLTPPLTL
jgi:hypothetical protein